MMGKYDMYTPLTVSQEIFYQECANTEFQKRGILPSYPVRETPLTNKLKCCRFHQSHGQNTDNCILLKDVIEGIIKRVG